MGVVMPPLAEDAPLSDVLTPLQIPKEFRGASGGEEEHAETIARLEEWRHRADVLLSGFKTRLQNKQALTVAEQGDVINSVAPLELERPWTTEPSRAVAKDILASYANADLPLLEHVLSQNIKPVFQRTPHPEVNVDTGRKLSRPAGGSAAFQDHFEGQFWKERIGTVDVFSWCVRHTETAMYERLWHLIIPPLMTIMDDYEVLYKLAGVRIVSDMLHKAPAELLRRTGVDGLLFTNLTKCLAFLDRPESPALLRTVISTSIALVELTTDARSSKRFEQLCALLGEGIIGTVWLHGMRDEEVVLASVDVLPALFRALGIGCARYLKALIPQLVYPLIPASENSAAILLQTASAWALCVVITECAPRIQNWKGTILDAVCRCWVTLVESGAGNSEARRLKTALQDVCQGLAQACPSVAEEEFRRLVDADEVLLKPLLQSSAGSRSS